MANENSHCRYRHVGLLLRYLSISVNVAALTLVVLQAGN